MAGQINGIADSTIIIGVSIGVGLALVAALLRILYQFPLSYLLIGCYLVAFILSQFTHTNFLSISWESGAVTTGPIMVPFIMAFGLGLASVRGDKAQEEDSFGLIAMCLIGPIITLLILGMFFSPSGGSALDIPNIQSLSDITSLFVSSLPDYSAQIAIALFPILLLFAIFQVVTLRLSIKTLLQIAVGTIYTFIGLVLFLTSVNIGFMPSGYLLGSTVIANTGSWVVILIGFVMGYLVVSAEPAVFVLKDKWRKLLPELFPPGHGTGTFRRCRNLSGLGYDQVVTGLSCCGLSSRVRAGPGLDRGGSPSLHLHRL